MKKRTAFILLTLALLLCLSPALTAADGNGNELPIISNDPSQSWQPCGDDLYWLFDESTGALTITGSGAMWDYRYLNDAPWGDVQDQITEISLPNGLSYIGATAFCRTKITSIVIPDTVTDIGGYAFWGCESLKQVLIPDNVSSIGAFAFYWCDLQTVSIPDSVAFIGPGAFGSCRNLTSFSLGENSHFKNIGGAIFSLDGKQLVIYPAGKRGSSYTIPEGTVDISGAFVGCGNLTSIIIPNTVANIGNYAFYECTGLTSITIPNGVTSIGDDAFGWSGLTSIIIPDGVTSIGHRAFDACSDLTYIKIPDSVTDIGQDAFSYSGLTSITLPDTITAIGPCALRYTMLTSITLPKNITSIGEYAFGWCGSLTSVFIPSSVVMIEDDAFCYCNMLSNIYYAGTEEQKEQIEIGNGNDSLMNATWHYESEPEPTYAITTQPQDITAWNGQKANFTVTVNNTKGVKYQWFMRESPAHQWSKAKSGIKATLSVKAELKVDGSQYYCEITTPDGKLISDVATLTVQLQAPLIKVQPKEKVTVKSGAKVKLTVKAAGVALSYQWFSRAGDDGEWAEIDGETKAEYTITASMAKNGRQYRCLVRNAGGEVYSREATLTVTPQPPVIKTHPKVTMTVKSGAKTKISVKATGPNLKYQWYKLANGAEDWEAMDGQTKADCTFVATLADNGAQFRCRVWNDDEEKMSGAATLTVTPVPPKFSTHPRSATVNAGATVTFKAKASGGVVTYQWYVKKTADGDWEPVDGETGLTLAVVAAAEMNGWQYACQADNTEGPVMSKPAVLKVR